MTTLYIRYPARAAAADSGVPASCQFALVGDGGNVMQQGAGALGNLGELVSGARRVVLLLAAADVSLLKVKVPPLSGARLKSALPHLVEEQVLGDPADCVLALAPPANGDSDERVVAVANRAWLEVLVKALVAQGAQGVSALPVQLCLPLAPGSASAALGLDDAGLELTLRSAPYEGLGLTLPNAPEPALHTLRALAGDAPVTLYVAPAQRAEYAAAAANVAGITLEEDNWIHRVAAAKAVTLDLAASLGAASGATARAWARWKWPYRIAVAVVVVNIVGLNWEFMRLKREAATVRQNMVQVFRAAYPNQPVTDDPAAQMRRNIAVARAGSGGGNADDFTNISAALGEALAVLPNREVVAGVDYKDRSMTVKFKPGSVDANALAQMQAALAQRKLSASESGPGVWLVKAGGK
ncbi:general secretion pathway protein GspL [Pseudoduganella sp. DS3]|uniref:General secretion pathway protein GspL n=1 Tax=Pseudoduganella guangdongensis TaxID=2692179 RepID=A0A6N9HLC9_9BURK|nr:type II secretion system protein GspL [Pseudoduganella guangdongensis]MYN04149.1 general secretion pathway protein GspL [Pseudoduganella guangdongensis]